MSADSPNMGIKDKVECPCGCGEFGVLSDKTEHVQRKCKCPRCIGRRNRVSGMKKQRQAKKRLRIPSARFHGQDGNEENWRGYFRTEVKSGKQVGGVAWFLRAEIQAAQNAAIGDNRPFAFVAMPNGMGSEGLITVRLSVWEQHIAPLLEEAL